MQALSELVEGLGLLPLLAFWALQAAVVLAVVGLLDAGLRRRPASQRHWVWSAGLLTVVTLPLLWTVIPSWDLSIEAVSGLASTTSSVGLSPLPGHPIMTAPAAFIGHETTSITSLPWAALLALLYGFVAISLLARTVGQQVRTWRALRGATVVEDPEWAASCVEVCARLRVRPVPIRVLPGAGVPFVAGVLRPSLYLPVDANGFDSALRQTVLIHELAHVRRHDCGLQLLAQVVAAIFWFNPLAWLGLARMRQLGELAADETVVSIGAVRPSTYAAHLVSVARRQLVAAPASLGMARPAFLETRIRRVLQLDGPTLVRQRRRRLLTSLLILAVALPIAGVQADPPSEPESPLAQAMLPPSSPPTPAPATQIPSSTLPSDTSPGATEADGDSQSDVDAALEQLQASVDRLERLGVDVDVHVEPDVEVEPDAEQVTAQADAAAERPAVVIRDDESGHHVEMAGIRVDRSPDGSSTVELGDGAMRVEEELVRRSDGTLVRRQRIEIGGQLFLVQDEVVEEEP